MFPDEETSIWEQDSKTGEYYLHHFYKHQPGLNVASAKVQGEISRNLGFWLELGVAGFRVDAVLLGEVNLPYPELYGRGLRRRLPSMVGGDGRRLRLMYSLMFALPGTPVLFYGEEIGMAENLDVPGRLAVRTSMQWTAGPVGGFSTAPPHRLVRPVTDGLFGPERVNVADQRSDHDSLWWFLRTPIRRRRESCNPPRRRGGATAGGLRLSLAAPARPGRPAADLGAGRAGRQ